MYPPTPNRELDDVGKGEISGEGAILDLGRRKLVSLGKEAESEPMKEGITRSRGYGYCHGRGERSLRDPSRPEYKGKRKEPGGAWA